MKKKDRKKEKWQMTQKAVMIFVFYKNAYYFFVMNKRLYDLLNKDFVKQPFL